MRPLVATAMFLLGIYLSLRLIAALYRILDLWYTIGTAWPRVVRGVLGWGGATVGIAVLAGDRLRPAFLLGLAAFAAFYLGLYALRNLYFFLRRPAA